MDGWKKEERERGCWSRRSMVVGRWLRVRARLQGCNALSNGGAITNRWARVSRSQACALVQLTLHFVVHCKMDTNRLRTRAAVSTNPACPPTSASTGGLRGPHVFGHSESTPVIFASALPLSAAESISSAPSSHRFRVELSRISLAQLPKTVAHRGVRTRDRPMTFKLLIKVGSSSD